MALGVPVTVRGDRAPRPASGRILQILVDHEEVALPARAHQEPFELVEPGLLGECGPPEVSSQAPSARGQIVKALQSRRMEKFQGRRMKRQLSRSETSSAPCVALVPRWVSTVLIPALQSC